MSKVYLSVLACGLAVAACATTAPPHTRTGLVPKPPPPSYATFTIFWPPSSCDPAGYFTIATSDGRFLGNIARGNSLAVFMKEGEHTLIAWNPKMEDELGPPGPRDVAVLNASLVEGRAYYARLAFGDWDETGFRRLNRFCDGHIPSLVRVPVSEGMVSEWLEDLEPSAPDYEGGQAWLDGHPEELTAHRLLGEQRLRALIPPAKFRARVMANDGEVAR